MLPQRCLCLLSACIFVPLAASPAFASHIDDENAATPVTTASSQQVVATQRTVEAVFDHLANLAVEIPDLKTGVSTGDTPLGINLWINPSYTRAHDDNSVIGYTSKTYGAFFGGDKALGNATLGLMLGIDHTDLDSKSNGGGSDTQGLTIAPYGRYKFNRTYSLDLTAGFTSSQADNDRLGFTGNRVTSDSDTKRWFAALGLNGSYWLDRWNFLGRAGTTLSHDRRGAFTESDGTAVNSDSSAFGQAQLGMTVSRYFTHLRPWVSATYAYDYRRKFAEVAAWQPQPSHDRSQMVLGLGLTVFGYGSVVGDLGIKQTVMREDYTNTQVGLTLSVPF